MSKQLVGIVAFVAGLAIGGGAVYVSGQSSTDGGYCVGCADAEDVDPARGTGEKVGSVGRGWPSADWDARPSRRMAAAPPERKRGGQGTGVVGTRGRREGRAP